MSLIDRDAIVAALRNEWGQARLAVYAFSSRIDGTAGNHSDLDLAVLVERPVEPIRLWEVAGELADLAGCAVDLLDFRAASTVMQFRVLTTGERWWQGASLPVGLFEAMVMSEKVELDEARAGLLDDIAQRGSVLGR